MECAVWYLTKSVLVRDGRGVGDGEDVARRKHRKYGQQSELVGTDLSGM